MATIRYRGGEKNILEIAKNLDAFRKVPDEYTESSQIGGTLSLLSRILIIILIYVEVSYYKNANLKFTFKPDIELDTRVKMNVDITVATPCIKLSGVDLVDETQQDVFSYGTLKRESTWFELSPEQRIYFDEIKHINSFLREEYHSVADVIFKNILEKGEKQSSKLPERNDKPNKPYDACRLYGSLTMNKVAGVFHIIAGDNTPYFGILDNHWHSNSLRNTQQNYTFTHRIHKLSFGDLSAQIIQPLEGDERYVPQDSVVVQYFIEIVPTEIHNLFSTFNAYQYSVKENFRFIDSHKNSYGVPGIYFKYDWSALKVIVQQDRDNMIQFIIRLCSIISGIVVISGIINSIIQAIHRFILRLIAPQIFQKTIPFDIKSSSNSSTEHLIPTIAAEKAPLAAAAVVPTTITTSTTILNPPTPILITNNLIINANEMNGDDSISITALPQ